MKPIELKADRGYRTALKCTEYRVPQTGSLKPPAYLMALALRYGLIGAAATQYLLLSTRDQEEANSVVAMAQGWPEMVEIHMLRAVQQRLPFFPAPSVPEIVGWLSYLPVGVILRLFPCCSPLEQSLNAAAKQFRSDYHKILFSGSSLFQRLKIAREFSAMSDNSVSFALHFFDRLQAGIEEVPEIALIGE